MTDQFIQGPAGALQVRVESGDADPLALAIVCHPHPLYGGSLDNKVVHQLAKTFVELGAIALRFNFRGVGGSEGEYDQGRGEVDDLLAVIEWARGRWPDLPLWLAGFSFGGYVALQAAQGVAPQRLITVAPAVSFFSGRSLRLQAELSWLLIQGDADEVVPATEVRAWLDGLERRPRLVVLEGAGHFFHGRLNDLKQAVIDDFAANRSSVS